MEKKTLTRGDIIRALKDLNVEGKQPGRKALKQKGINGYWIAKLIPEGLTELKQKHGIKISPQERPLSDDELLKKIDEVVSHLKRIPSWAQLRRETEITDKTFTNRFGNNGIRGVFGHYRKWLEEHHPESENIKLVDSYLRETKPVLPVSEEQDEIRSLLASVEKALRDRQQHVERLTEENRQLKANYEASQVALVVARGKAAEFIKTDGNSQYIHLSRVDELRAISSQQFDLTRLIELCNELNDNYTRGNVLAVPMLIRAIIDHVPPILGCRTFNEITNNYGGLHSSKSFKKSMQNLQNSLRNIADAKIHTTIRSKETLPNNIQIDFSRDLDVLLEEIVRILK